MFFCTFSWFGTKILQHLKWDGGQMLSPFIREATAAHVVATNRFLGQFHYKESKKKMRFKGVRFWVEMKRCLQKTGKWLSDAKIKTMYYIYAMLNIFHCAKWERISWLGRIHHFQCKQMSGTSFMYHFVEFNYCLVCLGFDFAQSLRISYDFYNLDNTVNLLIWIQLLSFWCY